MDKINFNQTGGFPLTTDILNAMQNAYNIFNSLGSLAGNETIISGCEQTGNNVGDGVVCINGELLPFKGGTRISRVRIVENTESKQFEDGQTKAVLFKRFVQFGTGVGAIPWRRFVRLNTTRNLNYRVSHLLERVEELESRPTFYKGMILLWNKPVSEIPEGFSPYLPLKGRMPIGRDKDYNFNASGDDTNYNLQTLGSSGGKREHMLLKREMPRHNHHNEPFKYLATFSNNLKNSSSQAGGGVTDNHDQDDKEYALHLHNTSYLKEHAEVKPEGENKPHTNMPPYTVVEFIIYVGV